MIYFQFLDIASNAAVNIYVQVSLAKMPRSAIAGVYSNCMFGFIRRCQTLFQSGCIILIFHQQFMNGTISLHPCQYWAFSSFSLDIRDSSLWFTLP